MKLHKNYHLYVIGAFVSLLGCFATHKINSNSSKYVDYNRDVPYYMGITLNKDKTFNYIHNVGLLSISSKGSWIDKKQQLLLTSDSGFKNGYLEIVEKDSLYKKDSISIEVVFKENNEPIPFIVLSLGEENQYSETNSDGKVFFKKNYFDSLTVEWFGEKYAIAFLKEPISDLKVSLIEKDLGKKYFNNEIWLKKESNLITPEGFILKPVSGEHEH